MHPRRHQPPRSRRCCTPRGREGGRDGGLREFRPLLVGVFGGSVVDNGVGRSSSCCCLRDMRALELLRYTTTRLHDVSLFARLLPSTQQSQEPADSYLRSLAWGRLTYIMPCAFKPFFPSPPSSYPACVPLLGESSHGSKWLPTVSYKKGTTTHAVCPSDPASVRLASRPGRFVSCGGFGVRFAGWGGRGGERVGKRWIG